MQEILLLILGLLGLWLGSGLVVEGSKKIALAFKVSYVLIGLTIVSIGTSLPEIMTSIITGLAVRGGVNASGIAVGTTIGSGLTQITAILGISALVGTITVTKKLLKRDGFMVLFSIALMFLAGIDGKITQVEGFLLITIYLFYLYVISKDEHVGAKVKEKIKDRNGTGIIKSLVLVLGGMAVLLISSDLVVKKGMLLANSMGVENSFVGVMIIGVSTCLPELTTAIRGVLSGVPELSAGTLIGSNITDPLFSLGIGALISGFTVDMNLLVFDIPFWFILTMLALFFMRKRLKLLKKEAIVLIMFYVLFVIMKLFLFK